MEYRVVKSGAEMFDAIHATGLGIILACASCSPIELRDEGITYRLSGPAPAFLDVSVNLLDQALAMPAATEIEAIEKQYGSVPPNIANLDGLLASLFTTPGVRAVSARDALVKRQFRPTTLQDALDKAQAAITRLRTYAERASRRAQEGWLLDLLRDYDSVNPQSPQPVANTDCDIAIPMTVDPILSYSTRRPLSDGLIAEKTNVAIHGTRYAGLLALVGAARFLRAQRVGGAQVNFYIPLIDSMMLYPDTSLPLLFFTKHPAEHAVVCQWLAYGDLEQRLGARWSSLGYHTMRTQGAQQSISLDRAFLDYAWLRQVEERAGRRVIGHWRHLLSGHRKQTAFEVDNLVECLSGRQAAAWLAHLRDAALHLHSDTENVMRPYHLKEVKEVTAMVTPSPPLLSTVLDREQGTLEFGRTLRRLGRQSPAALRDIVDALETVRTCDQLMRVLARAAQECVAASAHAKFAIIPPSDDDLYYLLEDVERHGAQSVAGLLIVLSALSYPRRSMTEPPEGPVMST